jgi:predicted porin
MSTFNTSLETSMKKPMVNCVVTRALVVSVATLGAAMGVHAQQAAEASPVGIYGIVDMGLTSADDGTTPGSMLNGRGAPNDVNLKAGNTSRLGFRRTEDMGNGSYARFQIETRFALDTGTSSNANTFWLGRSVIALGSKTRGEVYAGREYSAAYTVALQTDPTFWSYVSQLGSAYTYANYLPVAVTEEASNIRWSNTVGYKTPAMGPVTAEIATALSEGRRDRSVSANVQYKQGPLWVGFGYDGLVSSKSTNLAIVAAGYDLGVVRPTASYTKVSGGLNGDATSYTVAAMVPLSFGRTYVSYGNLRPANGLNSSMVGAGIQYDLTKATLLYVNYGSAEQSGKTRTNAIDFGVKHTF